MAESEYQKLDVLSCVILAIIFGSVGIVIFLLFFKSESRKLEEDQKDTSDSDGENKVQKPSPKPAHQPVPHKKKVVKDLGAIHPFLLASLKGHAGAVLDIDISSNGKLVGSCSEDRSVRLWNVKDFPLKEHKYTRVNVEFDYPSCISFSPDSRAFIVSLWAEKVLRVYKIHKKKEGGGPPISVTEEFDFPKEHKNEIINVAISPSGKFIISADKETQIVVWNLKGEILDKIDTLLVYNTYACVSPCGNLVAACGFTPDVKLWYVGFSKSGEFTQVSRAFGLKGHFDAILSFSFSNDSKRIATVSKDGTWKIWDIDIDYLKGQEAYLLHTGKYESVDGVPAHIAISHDYFTVAIALGCSIHFYNTSTHELEESLEEVHQGNVTALQWHADCRQLVSAGGSDRSLRVWHNPVGVNAHLLDLIDKLPKAKTESMKERIQNQIKESKEYLARFQP